MLLSLLMVSGALQHQAYAGDLDGTVEEAVALHLTGQGLDHLGDLVEALVPDTFPITAGGGSLDCDDDSSTPALAYHLSDLDLLLSVDDVRLSTASGTLALTLFGTLNSSAATLTAQGSCSILEDVDETCGVQLPTTALQADLSIAIREEKGAFVVEVAPMTVDISPVGNPLSDCTLASAVGTLLGQDSYAISQLLLDQIEPALADLSPTIAGAVQDALSSLAFETEFALLEGAALGISLYPSRLELSEAGLIVGLGADIVGGDSAPCVDTSAGPPLTGAGWPDFGENVSDTSLRYDVGLFVGRDFVDHLLWSAWGSGALCIGLEELNGAPLSSGLMSSFFGDEVAVLFGDSAPARLEIAPAVPPRAIFSDDQPPVAIGLEQLGVELYTALDARTLRALRVDVSGELGLNVGLHEGVLGTELLIDSDALDFDETYSELLWPGYSIGLPSLVELALGGLLPDDLLPTVTLPYLLGAELSEVVWMPTPDDAWLGGYLLLDTTSVQAIPLGTGCSADSLACDGAGPGFELDLEAALGCGGEGGFGCDGSDGCASGGRLFIPTGRLFPVLFVLLGALLRRRTPAH